MSTIYHHESSQTRPGVVSGGHRIHDMPLHQHSRHLGLQTTGDCSQRAGDCNQTPAADNQQRWGQLGGGEMHAMPQRVRSAIMTHRSVSPTMQGSSFFLRDSPSLVEESGRQLQIWRVWRVAGDAKKGFPAKSRQKVTRLLISMLLPHHRVSTHTRCSLSVCCRGRSPLDSKFVLRVFYALNVFA